MKPPRRTPSAAPAQKPDGSEPVESGPGDPGPDDPRPYHHGDLRRALLDAAAGWLDRDGAAALSLRGLARAAKVSPGAPYHHFRDKAALLVALGQDGYRRQAEAMARAGAGLAGGGEQLRAIGRAYVEFALSHPHLWALMTDLARRNVRAPEWPTPEGQAFALLQSALAAAKLGESGDPLDRDIAAFAAWAAAFGVAALVRFPQFDALKREAGGEGALIDRVLHALIERGPA